MLFENKVQTPWLQAHRKASTITARGVDRCSRTRLRKRCCTRAGENLLKAAGHRQALAILRTPTDAHHRAQYYGCHEDNQHSDVCAVEVKRPKTEFPHSCSSKLLVKLDGRHSGVFNTRRACFVILCGAGVWAHCTTTRRHGQWAESDLP